MNKQPPSPTTPISPASTGAGGGGGGGGMATTTTTTVSTLGGRRATKNPALDTKLAQMKLPLAPLVQLTTGLVHPDFPASLLSFWLLTDAQLDALAHFYHQRSPGPLTGHYPCPVSWGRGLTLEEKRRKIGKFIGLRGCDTPVVGPGGGGGGGGGGAAGAVFRLRTEEEIAEEARRARLREDEEASLRRKAPW